MAAVAAWLAITLLLPSLEIRCERPLADQNLYLDSAPFVIIVEHEDGRRCLASLVSQRTAVSTARCVRPHSTRSVWALASALRGPPPHPPLVAAARRVVRLVFAGNGRDLEDAANDLALFELEAPFGKAAVTSPIIMTSTDKLCSNGTWCYALHSEPALGKELRLYAINVTSVPSTRCQLVPSWTSEGERLLCLKSMEPTAICEKDLGGGVVCEGRLCGVSSQIGARKVGTNCSNTFAAQGLSYWRHFLKCAHTLRLCGRGTCSGVCTEERLLLDSAEPERSEEQAGDSEETTIEFSTSEPSDSTIHVNINGTQSQLQVSRTSQVWTPVTFHRKTKIAPTRTLPVLTKGQDVQIQKGPKEDVDSGLSIDFEPNQQNFRVTSSHRNSSNVRLKPGEHGENAAEYGASESVPSRRTEVHASSDHHTDIYPHGTQEMRVVPDAPSLQLSSRATSDYIKFSQSLKILIGMLFYY